MDHWFLPITFLPAIGLFILSTANMLNALKVEIDQIKETHAQANELLKSLIKQLTRLTIAQIFLYISALFFALAGLLGVTMPDWTAVFHTLLILGVVAALSGFFSLAAFAIRGLAIRRRQHRK